MKVRNMTTNEGRVVPNQFIVSDIENGTFYFQSYQTIIAVTHRGEVKLDHQWDSSKTTGKYRNKFLGESREETERKIKDGTYIVTDLNS